MCFPRVLSGPMSLPAIAWSGWSLCGRGSEIRSGKYKLNLYFKYDNELKLSWKNILIEFGELNPPTRTGITGIIICESEDNNYAITYGPSSFLVQKYSDREFGFNFAKRIELKEMKSNVKIINRHYLY